MGESAWEESAKNVLYHDSLTHYENSRGAKEVVRLGYFVWHMETPAVFELLVERHFPGVMAIDALDDFYAGSLDIFCCRHPGAKWRECIVFRKGPLRRFGFKRKGLWEFAQSGGRTHLFVSCFNCGEINDISHYRVSWNGFTAWRKCITCLRCGYHQWAKLEGWKGYPRIRRRKTVTEEVEP